MMHSIRGNRRNHARLLATGLVLVLVACSHSPDAGTASGAGAGAGATANASEEPKVPFGNRPCQSLTTDEIRNLGIAKPAQAKPEPGHEPDDLTFENTCDFGYQTLVYTTKSNYETQRNELRNPRHNAPADLPSAFYDVLGNLWFAEKGYYVTVPNNAGDNVKGKMARVIAAKL